MTSVSFALFLIIMQYDMENSKSRIFASSNLIIEKIEISNFQLHYPEPIQSRIEEFMKCYSGELLKNAYKIEVRTP